VHSIIRQNLPLVFRHLVVSAISACIELLLFYLGYLVLGIPLVYAHLTGFTCATVVGFVLHSFYTFQIDRLSKRNALMFAIQVAIAFAIGYWLLAMLIHAGVPAMYAKVSQLVLVFGFNVLTGRLVSFK
jgi:putative flippase GtrA